MKYYVAYGSNLNREQMAHRCPDAKLVGTGVLSNYEMVFRGNKSNAVATVRTKKGNGSTCRYLGNFRKR